MCYLIFSGIRSSFCEIIDYQSILLFIKYKITNKIYYFKGKKVLEISFIKYNFEENFKIKIIKILQSL